MVTDNYKSVTMIKLKASVETKNEQHNQDYMCWDGSLYESVRKTHEVWTLLLQKQYSVGNVALASYFFRSLVWL